MNLRGSLGFVAAATAIGTVFCSSACSSTPGPGPGDASPDGSQDAGTVLSFSPSNLGSLLSTIDTSALGDMDSSEGGGEIGPDCAGTRNDQGQDGCVATTVTLSNGSTANVFVVRSWKVEQQSTVKAALNGPVIVVATRTIQIFGAFRADANEFTPGSGGYSGGTGTNDEGPGGG